VDAARVTVPREIPRRLQIALANLGLPRDGWHEWLDYCEATGQLQDLELLEDALLTRHVKRGEPLFDDTKQLLGPELTRDVETMQKLYHGKPQAPAEQTVEHFKNEWLRRKKVEVSPDRYDNYERWMAEFVKHVGPTADVKSIDAGTLDSFYTYCCERIKEREHDSTKGWSIDWAQDVFRAGRRFIHWLVDTEKINPPRNLTRPYRFNSVPAEPNPWSVEEVKTVLGLAKGRLRLYMLLALNCGYGAKDIADLRPDEVDLNAGIIDRYRSKTKKCKSRRKLAFVLWPSTLELLREHAGQGERLLTAEDGTPLRGDKRRDVIASNFENFRERHIRKALPGFDHSFYELRKTSATLIGDKFGQEYARYFLNHSPRRDGQVAVYQKLSPEKLAEAVDWLGRQLGLVND
jgi:integrase